MGVDASHHGGSAFPGLDGVYSRYEGSIKDGNAYANGNGTTDIAVKDKVCSPLPEYTPNSELTCGRVDRHMGFHYEHQTFSILSYRLA